MKVKAGLTGYAQIYGKYNTSYETSSNGHALHRKLLPHTGFADSVFGTLNVLFIPESTEGFTVETLTDMPAQQNGEAADAEKAPAQPEHKEEQAS